jgi:L-asparaginase II
MKTGSVATSNSVKAAIASSGTSTASGLMGAGRGRIQEKSGAEPVYCIWM